MVFLNLVMILLQELFSDGQLKRWRIPYHEIIFREKGDHREDHVYKLEAIAKLMGRYRIEALYDGSGKVLEAVKGKYPRIKAVKV
ncbi:MAG: hypothetical protein G5Z42_00330 [Caldisphaeraceae archaeon]|nr:hypothetical protein [Caldisphaeraceae archaeon]